MTFFWFEGDYFNVADLYEILNFLYPPYVAFRVSVALEKRQVGVVEKISIT